MLLTQNEVENARYFYPSIALFIVHGIQLERGEPGQPIGTGGSAGLLEPWNVESCELLRLNYQCSLPRL